MPGSPAAKRQRRSFRDRYAGQGQRSNGWRAPFVFLAGLAGVFAGAYARPPVPREENNTDRYHQYNIQHPWHSADTWKKWAKELIESPPEGDKAACDLALAIDAMGRTALVKYLNVFRGMAAAQSVSRRA
jgi:hypothetical protein